MRRLDYLYLHTEKGQKLDVIDSPHVRVYLIGTQWRVELVCYKKTDDFR